MSEIAAVFRRDGRPVEVAELDRMEAAFVGDGAATGILADDFGARCQVFPAGAAPATWFEAEARVSVLFDGRIDNPGELDDPQAPGGEGGDAGRFLRHFLRGGVPGLARVVGAFAAVIFDHRNRRLYLVRDALGQRALCYRLAADHVVVASDDGAVLAHARSDPVAGEARMALLFAFAGRASACGWFDGVDHLLPGQCLEVTATTTRPVRYWQADTGRRIRYRDPGQYAEHFRALLRQAVACRLPASGPLASMTSGGLDSAPMTALAGREGADLRVYTWGFTRHAGCDEGHLVAALCQRHGLPMQRVACDALGPFSDFDRWPVDPYSPDHDPYRRFLDACYDAARNDGASVMLSGSSGDVLYAGGDRWFWELVASGQAAAAWQALARHARAHGAWPTLRNTVLRAALPMSALRGLQRLRRGPGSAMPPWLTARALDRLAGQPRWPPEVDAASRPGQAQALLSAANGDWMAVERRWARRHGIEVRYPFRDRRLVEFMLALPDEQLARPGDRRSVLRRAVADLLPASIAERRDKTRFTPLFDDGLAANREAVMRLLGEVGAPWRDCVRPEWLLGDAAASPSLRDSLLWTALGVSLWCAFWRQRC